MAALHILRHFAKFSGLHPNMSKTSAIWFGSKMNCKDVLGGNEQLSWTSDPFRVLGIVFSTHLSDMPELNFEPRVLELKKRMASWNRRQLTLIGRITVVKTMLIPLLTHVVTSLPAPDSEYMKTIERMLHKFLWKGGIERVARTAIVQEIHDGGLRMTHFPSYVASLKVKWFTRLFFQSAPWTRLFEAATGITSYDIIMRGRDFLKQHSETGTRNCFWRDCLAALHGFRKAIEESSEINLTSECLWYNPNIRIGGSSVYRKSWDRRGIKLLTQILDSSRGCLLSNDQFYQRYFPVPEMVLNSLRSSTWHIIRQATKDSLSHSTLRQLPFPYIPPFLYELQPLLAKEVYAYTRNYSVPVPNLPLYQARWQEDLEQEIPQDE
eukprot:GHVO01017056.1.p1 GENE.GHVO01017056.1~~GHVO01017056.1.p1  ORF type:complete len:427 (+),score=25.79 GHVO01017056.1:143-1282(+)